MQKQIKKVIRNLKEGVSSYRNLDELNDIVELCTQLEIFQTEQKKKEHRLIETVQHSNRMIQNYEYLLVKVDPKECARVCKQADKAINEAAKYLKQNHEGINQRNKIIYKGLRAVTSRSKEMGERI